MECEVNVIDQAVASSRYILFHLILMIILLYLLSKRWNVRVTFIHQAVASSKYDPFHLLFMIILRYQFIRWWNGEVTLNKSTLSHNVYVFATHLNLTGED
jgi:hypothetical protein